MTTLTLDEQAIMKALRDLSRSERRWSETLDAHTKALCESMAERGLIRLVAGKYEVVS